MSTLFNRMNQNWSPWDLLGEFSKLAGPVDPGGVRQPGLNAYRSDEGLEVEVSLPGFDAESLDVQIEDRQLRITAERPEATLDEGVRWVCRERSSGRYERSMTLPYAVDPASVRAKYQNGILTVSLKPAKEMAPRKIDIQLN